MKRIVLGGILAGIVVFAWGAISHILLPLGGAGFRILEREEPVVAALREGAREPGLYFFPTFDPSRKMTPEEEKAWTEKYVAGPTGLIVYRPGGEPPAFGRNLAVELVTTIAAAMIAAYVVSLTVAPFRKRVLLVAMLGLFAWFSISASYWTWFGYPASYVIAEGIDQVVGWLFGGLVLAAMWRRAGTPVQAAAAVSH